MKVIIDEIQTQSTGIGAGAPKSKVPPSVEILFLRHSQARLKVANRFDQVYNHPLWFAAHCRREARK